MTYKSYFYFIYIKINIIMIEAICGPMFSGKTEELIRRLKRAQIARKSIIVFKPQIDNRYNSKKIITHSKQSFLSKVVKNSKHMNFILKQIKYKINVIGIDEIQFFDHKIINIIEKLANINKRIIAAGLDQDYLGNPFGPMPALLAIADKINKQSAICMVCGNTATKTQRIYNQKLINKINKQILIGTTELYEARCRACYVKILNTSKKQIKN